jgi:hypothetical protein
MNTKTLNREFRRAGVHLLKASGILLGAPTIAAVVTDLATRTMGYSPPVQQYSGLATLVGAFAICAPLAARYARSYDVAPKP